MANMAILLMCVAVTRQVSAFIENPAGSTLFSFLGMNLRRLSWLTTGYGDRCAYVARKLKKVEGWKKSFKFACTDSWILAAMRKCQCGHSWRHTPLMDDDGTGKLNGRAEDMKRSSSYPPALGSALLEAWWSWRSHAAGLQLSSGPAVQKLSSRPAAQVARNSGKPGHSANKTTKKSGKPGHSHSRKTDSDFFDSDPIVNRTAKRARPMHNKDFVESEGEDSDFLV